jgi:hypothetical protein
MCGMFRNWLGSETTWQQQRQLPTSPCAPVRCIPGGKQLGNGVGAASNPFGWSGRPAAHREATQQVALSLSVSTNSLYAMLIGNESAPVAQLTCSVPITTKLELTNHYCLLFDQRILDQQQYDRERERENSRVTKQQVLWLVGVMELL